MIHSSKFPSLLTRLILISLDLLCYVRSSLRSRNKAGFVDPFNSMLRGMFPESMKLPVILCLVHLFFIAQFNTEADELASTPIIARPGCKDNCGNVSIPFPWGIGANCFLDSWFEIECKPSPHSNDPPKPFLSKFDIELLEIDLSGYQTVKVRSPALNVCTTDTKTHQLNSIDLRGGPYNFSSYYNVFIMEGCAGSAVLFNQSKKFMAGCATVCLNNDSAISTKECYGVECCQTQLPSYGYNNQYSPFQFYQIDFQGQPSGRGQNCLAATLIDNDHVNEYIGKISTSEVSTVPLVLLWSWISNLRPDQNDTNLECYPYSPSYSIFCSCAGNSDGINPYVTNGCQVPKKCEGCGGFCVRGEGYTYSCHPKDRQTFFSSTTAIYFYIALSIALGPLLLVFGCRWLYYFTKKRRKAEKRVKFFKLMLQRHQSSNNGVVESTKLFTHRELDKATEHFNDNRVLGKGGQGTVYKGMLTDGRIVAVKKSKLMDETQMEQFINEVVILSQTNHRNVVKLLGCCLETEVPLLAYEFISNGTLHQHIHGPGEDVHLSWAMRLKIAADSAGAIAYLHASSSTPIYHRDIKSSNILLDDKYRAKVSDFGSSKTIEIDQTHLTTLVQGTLGYLDPEYFETSIFTEKSDVYSFGVVLLELLTSKKPIYRIETMEQKSLVTEFFLHIQNSSLSNLLDPEVVKESKQEEIIAFVDLAKRCLNGSGRLRPTMKEVAMTLEMIIKSPAETYTRDEQAFLDEGFDEIVMRQPSDAEFISSTFRGGAASPLYIDVEPLLRDTI